MMTSQAFEAALDDLDEDVSQLRQLVTVRDNSEPSLPTIAGTYLRAFCDNERSLVRRRWIGIALIGMLDTVPSVVDRLKELKQELYGLGDILLSNVEREETRILAGVIMRQAIEQGIDFASFWASEKVKGSAANFPEHSGPRWMGSFQSFLDTLGDLAIANPTTDPSIVYPVSVVANDGLKWADKSCPIALTQDDVVTIIAPDEFLREFRFVDIPISHLSSTRVQPSALHDSQSRQTRHEPWELILTLDHEEWTYRLNTAKCSATMFTIMFEQSGDAKECESAIKELQDGVVTNPVPFVAKLVASQQEDQVVEPSRGAGKHQRTVRRSSHIDKSRPQARQQRSRKLSPYRSDNLSSNHLSKSPKRAIRKSSRITPKPPLEQESEEDVSPYARDTPGGPTDAETASIRTTPKRKTYAKGKLHRVSEAAKKQASQHLTEHEDIFDMPVESGGRSVSGKQNSLTNGNSQAKAPRNKRKAAEDDEDFVPDVTKATKKPSTKRKAASNTQLGAAQPKKKARTAVAKGVRSIDTTSSRQRAAKPNQKPPSILSSRTSVIRGLLHSQSPSRAAKPSFKKPHLPVRGLQPPSTPTRSRSQLAIPLTEPLTPAGIRQPSNMSVSFKSSITPLNSMRDAEEPSVHHNTAGTEILSSNSKPVPASPNAESTAISGHAGREDVDLEKRKGDLQTAKCDPFQQRSNSSKISSFVRRLTEDDLVQHVPNPIEGPAQSLPKMIVAPGDGEKLNPIAKAVSPPLPPPKKGRDATITSHYSTMSSGEHACSTVRKDEMLSSKAPLALHVAAPVPEEEDSIMPAPQEEVEDTQLMEQAVPGQDNTNVDGDTTLINQSSDLPHLPNMKASPIRFRSSPPLPGSPSSHSSTSAESEHPSPLSVLTSEVEEMEWEAALEPHQRNLHDLLIRVSKRVLRHIVDNEAAVTDIAEVFANDGEHLLEQIIERHDSDYAHLWEDMDTKKKALRKELEGVGNALAKQRKAMGPVA